MHLRSSVCRAVLCTLPGGLLALAGCSAGSPSPAPVGPTLTVSGTLAAGNVGSAYSGSLSVSGGTAPYSCTVASGSLPGGLAVGAGCSLSGTPTATGTFNFTAHATDSGNPQGSGTGSFSVVINPPRLAFSSNSLPVATVSVAYSATIPLTGGSTPYVCKLTSGTLPDGLTLSNCQITGVPTTAGSATLGFSATDASTPTQSASGTVSLTVNPPGAPTRVLSGNLPVAGASVQIYAVGTTGNGSAPKALLSTPMVTDASGSFHVNTAAYTCPSSSTPIYIVATGGTPGTNAANAGIALMSSPGACSSLSATSNLILNEVSTVASVYALAPFMSAGARVGASATNTSGVALALGTLNNLVDVTSGTMPGPQFPVATATPPTAKINLLAQLVSGCINLTVANACTAFYSNATPAGSVTAPTNTIDALLNLAKNPGLNVSALYALAQTETPPIPSSVPPADWTLHVSYSGGGLDSPSTIALDSRGRVWVANYFSVASLFSNTGVPVSAAGLSLNANDLENSYGAAVDASDNFWIANEEGGPTNLGTVTVLNPSGQAVDGSPFTQGGLDFPISIAFDPNGTAWVVDYGDSSVTLLSSTGAPLSGANGYTTTQFAFPVAVAVDGKHFGWVANQSASTVTKVAPDGSSFTSYTVGLGPSGLAVDAQNNVWTANYYGDTVGLVSGAGSVVSPAGGWSGGGLAHPQNIAVDGAGTPWVANFRGVGISQLAPATSATPGALLSPALGWGSDAHLLETFSIAVDSAGSVWVSNFGNNTITEFVGLAVPVKMPLMGPAVAP